MNGQNGAPKTPASAVALLLDRGFSFGQSAVKWGAIAYMAYQGQLALGHLAGKSTVANLFVSYITDTASGATVSISISISVVACAWAYGERKLRYEKVNYLQDRIKGLELRFDPNRSSSGLTTEGRTNPNDE